MVLVSAVMFCLVYGFSNAGDAQLAHAVDVGLPRRGRAAAHRVRGAGRRRAAHPLLPPRVVLDRNRGGAYLAVLVVGVGMFGVFLFLTYYLQTTLGYSPVMTGVAFLPMIGTVMVFAQISTIVLMPRIGPKPLIGAGMLVAAGGLAWLTGIGVDSTYVGAVLGPIMVTGAGIGMSMPPAMNTGHVRRGADRRGRRVGHPQRRAAARRLDRHRAAQHDRDQRRGDLRRQPHRRGRGLTAGRGAAAGDGRGARLPDGLLVGGRDLRRRRDHLRQPVPPRAADPAGDRRRGRRAAVAVRAFRVRPDRGPMVQP